ncbi:GNAT family N-acetyltransferase [Rhodoligotrophos defluvii]|uniref:GNAT family N-acetyltransferase n=1 Tax=Rhodoligotrophos defluvii TaxID=2561934 RepID=UPI0010C9FA0C|nr:GNAT family N-acetyltransferase [Rhodoligotrophos defluvii]
MSLSVRTLTGTEVLSVIEGLARLRIQVFREFPYLYDGDLAYEERYLANYAKSPNAAVVTVSDDALPEEQQLVGAATCVPLVDEPDTFRAPVAAAGIDISQVCYFGESVLDPAYRGRGIGHMFFDGREAHARALGLPITMFCAVIRPADHPLRPAGYRPLDPFWRKRGYVELPGVVARLAWKDLNCEAETVKELQFWERAAP